MTDLHRIAMQIAQVCRIARCHIEHDQSSLAPDCFTSF